MSTTGSCSGQRAKAATSSTTLDTPTTTRRRSTSRLQLKILTWSFIPALCVLGAVAVVIFYAYQDVTGDLVIGRDRELTRLAAQQIGEKLSMLVSTLDVETRTEGLGADKREVQQRALRRAGSRLRAFDGGLVLLDALGTVVAAEPARSEIAGQPWADRTYYQSIFGSESEGLLRPIISDVVPDGPGGADVVALALPIEGEYGQPVGVVVGMFLVAEGAENALYASLAQYQIGKGGDGFVVDSGGRVVYHTDPASIAGDASRIAAVRQVVQGFGGAIRDRSAEGEDIVASYAPIPGTPWGLVNQQAWTALMAPSQGYRRLLLALLLLGVLAPALVVVIGVRRITRPVKQLIEAAQKVASGDFNQSISAETGDEIEDLSLQFNRMAAQLRTSYARLEERAEARTRELAALNAIATVVSQTPSLERVLHSALREALEVIGVEAGGIYLLGEAANVLTIAAHQGLSEEMLAGIDGLQVGEGFSGRVVLTGEPLVIGDVSNDPRLTRPAVRAAALRALATVPIRSRGRVLGTLFAMSQGSREFSGQDVQLLTSIGLQIGVAVENARLFAQVAQRMQELEKQYLAEQRRAEQFRVINEVGRSIISIQTPFPLMCRMAQIIQEAFNYYHVGIGLVEGDEVVYRVGAGPLWADPEFEFMPPRLKIGDEGVTGWVAAAGRPLLVPDVSQEPRYVWLHGSRTRSELTVPILSKDRVVGVLDVQSDRLNAFDSTDVDVLQALANQAAVALENATLYEQAQQVAVMEERNRLARDLHDAVTQTLFSASLIAEAVPRVWERDADEGRELLSELRRLSRGALAEMRTLLMELRPASLTESNLSDLLRQLGEAAAGRTGVPVTVRADRTCALAPELHVALYRIAQEALNNVFKHANARSVEVELLCATCRGGDGRDRPARLELRVQDDGVGFEPQAASAEGLGLAILRERAESIGAELQVESAPGQGTTVRVVWTGEG